MNYINEILSFTVNFDETLDYELTSFDFDWLDLAKEALEKQIPKKPNTETANCSISISGEYDIVSVYLCPNCNAIVGDYEINDILCKFCPNCGQALDWSECNKKENN